MTVVIAAQQRAKQSRRPMVFSLGSSAPNPAPAGSTPTATRAPAPSSNPPFASPAPPNPTFGSTPAAAPSFGSTAAAPSFGSTAPAPSFGAPTPAAAPAFGSSTPAPSFGAASTPAPSFGSTTSNPTAPKPPSFGAGTTQPGGATSAIPAFGSSTTQQATGPNYIQVGSFQERFSSQHLLESLDEYIRSPHDVNLEIDGDQLNIVLQPKLAPLTQANQAVRQQLISQRTVKLQDKEAPLTDKILKDVFQLSDSMKISEQDAIVLYAEAIRCGGGVDLANELYRDDRLSCFLARLQLATCFAQAPSAESDFLFTKGWINNMTQFIRDASKRIKDVSRHVPSEWNRTIEERQLTADALYFAAYELQWTAEEVVSLVDIIRELCADLPHLDSRVDVPDVYKQRQWTGEGKLKDAIEWESDLVENQWREGRPQLLRCISTLVVAAMSTMDTKATLWDRVNHQRNDFGMGNAILPPGSTSLDSLRALDTQMSKSNENAWNRRDIFGLLVASYAQLLQAIPSTSPRKGTRHGTPDIRKSLRRCLDAPIDAKSFTFARLSLLPALEKSTDKYNICEFYRAQITDFTTTYLDMLSSAGEIPISRAKWFQNAEEQLKLEKQSRQQDQDFLKWSGNAGNTDISKQLPDSVDVGSCPDCMDDIILFATSVARMGPAFALKFWNKHSVDGGVNNLELTRTTMNLSEEQSSDHSLRPVYLGFLAALATATDYGSLIGSDAIHTIFARDSGSEGIEDSWVHCLTILNRFVLSLSKTAGSTSTMKPSATSTAYYYYDRDSGLSLPSSTPATLGPRELSEDQEMLLHAILELIQNVSHSSAPARIYLLELQIGTSRENPRVSLLQVLFSLSMCALSPFLRGRVFSSIASLISLEAVDDTKKSVMAEATRQTWELLEEHQILPVYKVEQFASKQATDEFRPPQMSFPISSLAMASATAHTALPIPKDPSWSILYEMAYVERGYRVYPSTTGMLRLLKALFRTDIIPASLGAKWSRKTGCSPYLEYVLFFVLRLTKTTDASPTQYFSSPNSKLQLEALCYEITRGVLGRFKKPVTISTKSSHSDRVPPHTRNDPSAAGLMELQKPLVMGHASVHPNGLVAVPETDSSEENSTLGLLVLASFLSADSSGMLSHLVAALRYASETSDSSTEAYILASCLFGSSLPSFQSLLKQKSKQSYESITTDPDKCPLPSCTFEVHLRKRCVLSILQIIQTLFAKQGWVNHDENSPVVIPIARFDNFANATSRIVTFDTRKAQPLTRLLLNSLTEQSMAVDTFLRLLTFYDIEDSQSFTVSSLSTDLLFSIDSYHDTQSEKAILWGANVKAQFGKQMHLCLTNGCTELLHQVLRALRTNLRKGINEESLTSHVLGEGTTQGSKWRQRYPGGVLDVLIAKVRHRDFIIQDGSTAKVIYEVLSLISHDTFDVFRDPACQRLGQASFWLSQLEFFRSGSLTCPSDPELNEVFQCGSWIIQALSVVLQRLNHRSLGTEYKAVIEATFSIVSETLKMVPLTEEQVIFEKPVSQQSIHNARLKTEKSTDDDEFSDYVFLDIQALPEADRDWGECFNRNMHRDLAAAQFTYAVKHFAWSVNLSIDCASLHFGLGERNAAWLPLLFQVLALASDSTRMAKEFFPSARSSIVASILPLLTSLDTRSIACDDALSITLHLSSILVGAHDSRTLLGPEQASVVVSATSLCLTYILPYVSRQAMQEDQMKRLVDCTLAIAEHNALLSPNTPDDMRYSCRSCLTLFLKMLVVHEEGNDLETLSVASALAGIGTNGQRSVITSFIYFLQQGDDSIVDVLLSFCSLKNGSVLLLESGILKILQEFSQSTQVQISPPSLHGVNVPSFLRGHLQVLLSIMTGDFPNGAHRKVAVDALAKVFADYDGLFASVMANMGSYPELSHFIFKNLAVFYTLDDKCALQNCDESLSTLLEVFLHTIENPPAVVKSPEALGVTSNDVVSGWWLTMKSALRDASDFQLIQFAIEIIQDGIIVAKAVRARKQIDMRRVLVGLQKLHTLNDYLKSVNPSRGENKIALRLSAAITRIEEDLLLLFVSLLRTNQSRSKPVVVTFRSEVLKTLDVLRVNSLTFNGHQVLPTDENKVDRHRDLLKCVRDEL